ncbi:tyrosine-type recombinase/integrase [Brucepastera parasyntrophica]|uniref:tyrosine-type recombinase/integrase n=1 Tax=Brucepastera parasyntrophica TaxID=2880008 RepID=UPI00210A89CC|nr:tyrosine-type recombinase/integrase [Brucepastera parasyntrophica]ULQ60163.1 tyrosine-type recombinase/integrase [Brucepastera parasyntrophica]
MDQYFENYLAYIAGIRNLSPRTVSSYQNDLALFDAYLSGESPLEANTADIRLFLADLGKKNYEPSSINRTLAAVRGFYRYLIRFGLRKDNPASGIRNLKVPQKLPRFLFAEDAQKFCASPSGGNLSGEDAGNPASEESHKKAKKPSLWPARDTALLMLLYSTGCRVSELAGLKMEDMGASGTSAIVTGKGNKDRKVFFSKPAQAALAGYLPERKALLDTMQENTAGKKALFISRRGNPLSVRGIQFIVAHYSENSNELRHLSPHALRHSFATTMINRGADIRIVQELLGHASISTTQKYTHVTQEQLKELYHQTHPHG